MEIRKSINKIVFRKDKIGVILIAKTGSMPFEVKQQRRYQRSRKPLTSSTNTRQSVTRKQKSYSKKENMSDSNQRVMNRSTATIAPQGEGQEWTKNKESIKQSYFYDKYYEKYHKKQFPNISIIEEKESILSNQENSLDSLNNFIIQGNRKQTSLVEKSREQSSLQEDWTLLYKQCQHILLKSSSTLFENEYLQVLSQLDDTTNFKVQSILEPSSQIISVSQRILKLNQYIKNLKRMKKIKQHSKSSEVFENPPESLSFHHEKSSIFNDKSLSFKLTTEILRKSQTAIQKEQFAQKNFSILSKLPIKPSHDSNKRHHTSDHLLQHFSQEGNKFIEEEENKFTEETNNFIEEENKFNEQESPSAHFQSTEKQQEEFMKFIDKKYSEDNQPNFSLNNISKIMRVRPKEHHNKSIENENENENENEIKQKEDDEVVAMLQNELRGNIIEEIPQIEEPEILLKESRDNLCLNQLEGDIQQNIQPSQIQQEVSDENKNFFFALQARQKWIKSLEKDEKWKLAELALLSKMKKILHNPYIEFPEE